MDTVIPSATLRPTRTSTVTATPRMVMSDVRITRPGHLSRLVSPIQMYFSLIPFDYGFVRIELLGEDGRLLYRNLIRYGMTTGNRLPMTETLDFAIPGAGELGRLQVVVEDSDQRVVALSSVDVILLAMGENERNPGGDNLDPFNIQKPWTQALVEGGVMQVSGYLRPVNTVQPLIFEIFSSKGELVGSKQLTPQEVINGRHYPFELGIPYQVPKATWARLVIRQTGTRIPGDAALTSIQIFLKP